MAFLSRMALAVITAASATDTTIISVVKKRRFYTRTESKCGNSAVAQIKRSLKLGAITVVLRIRARSKHRVFVEYGFR